MEDNTLFTAGALTEAEVPREVKLLAYQLSRIHGDVSVSREGSGLHLYMASPMGLEQDGVIELKKRHLAVNADRYFGFGKFRNRKGTYNADWSGNCMKTDTPYRVSQLLQMKPLVERGIKVSEAKVHINVRKKHLVPDGKGNMIPQGPGRCIPVVDLPTNHPASMFMHARGLDPKELWFQFRASFCEEETPEDPTIGLWYSRMPDGWRNTPQGRLVLFGDIAGVQYIWQARILELVEGSNKFFWHPYRKEWVCVITAAGLEPAYRAGRYEWKPQKYKTAQDGERNQTLIGADAAQAWNIGRKRRVCILTEGPLDAAKFRAPAVAMMGKYCSPGQAQLLAARFDVFFLAMDNDEVGIKSLAKVKENLAGKGTIIPLHIPTPHKDPGDMSYAEADFIFKEALKQHNLS